MGASIIAVPAVESGRLNSLARQAGPVKRQIRMRVLQCLHDFGIEGPAADLGMGWRTEQIKNSGPRRALPSPVRVQDNGAFVASLIPRIANKWHGLTSCRI